MSQQGRFFAGTIGFPIRITLVDKDGAALIPSQIGVDEIESVLLIVKRPNGKSFTRTLTPPGCLVGSAIEYVLVAGDVSSGGRYAYDLTLDLTFDRQLPVSGAFQIDPLEFA